jgi:chemosensory pili system protein ChpA (sensor histidine kinase/response regulator)
VAARLGGTADKAADLSEASGPPSSLSSAAATAAAGTPQATPASGLPPGRGQLDSSALRSHLQRQALLIEAAAAAAAADSAAAAAAAAEAAAAALEAEEAAAAADATAFEKATCDPDLQRVFAAFAAFGQNAELRGEEGGWVDRVML